MAQLHKLTDRKVKSDLKPGKYGDGGCLVLFVKKSGSKSFAFVSDKKLSCGKTKRISYGLGGYPTVSLAQARAKAAELRLRMKDPVFCAKLEQGLSVRDILDAEAKTIAADQTVCVPTFWNYAKQWMDLHVEHRSKKSPKAQKQWYSSIQKYAEPILDMPIDEITMHDVRDCFLRNDYWTTVNETCRRVQQRLWNIFAAAKIDNLVTGDNPAQWRGYLELALPAVKRAHKHHQAVRVGDMPAVWAKLRQLEFMSGLALKFLILTASRQGEARGARWDEIDFEKKVWTIPGERMKAGKMHQVPLCESAMKILDSLKPFAKTPFVFHSTGHEGFVTETALRKIMKKHVTGYTMHGFRSTFRDWAGNETEFPRELMEEALAHQLGSVEAAYRRGKAVERRRVLMEAWSEFLDSYTQSDAIAA